MATWDELRALAVEQRRPTKERRTDRFRRSERQCAGKSGWPSRQAAKNAATSVARRNGDRRMRPYRCEVCFLFHLSHNGRTK